MILAFILFIGATLLISTMIPVVHKAILDNKINYLKELEECQMEADKIN